MAAPVVIKTITTQTDTSMGTVPGDREGIVLNINGTFNGATATASYKAADKTIKPYTDSAAAITADGQIVIRAGNRVEVFLTTSAANPTGIDVLVSYF